MILENITTKPQKCWICDIKIYTPKIFHIATVAS